MIPALYDPKLVVLGVLAAFVIALVALVIRWIRDRWLRQKPAGDSGGGATWFRTKPATRSHLQATYTPRKPRPGDDLSKGRGLEKAAFASHLALSNEELDALTNRCREKGTEGNLSDTVPKERTSRVIGILAAAMKPGGNIDALRCAQQFADLEYEDLVSVAEDLIVLRRDKLANLAEANPTKSDPACLALGNQLHDLRGQLEAFKSNMTAEAVGYLHLERLCFTPAGIERGELVYSVPLSPGEQVNIAHKEWSDTSEEFERIATDYKEEYSEEGVTEKSELAQSVNSQTQHSTALSTGVTATGSYGSVLSVTASLSYNVSDSATKSEQTSRNHSAELTKKASSRSKQEHKMSFKVASAAGTEDQTVRLIKNPFTDRATRVDYYQLLRKWRVDLYRYGVRLTWDLVIPEEIGKGYLSRLIEIARIEKELENDFQFALLPDQLTPDNYQEKIAQYNIENPEEPPRPDTITVFESKDWSNLLCGDSETDVAYVFEKEIPSEYKVKNAKVSFYCQNCNDPPNGWNINIWDLLSEESMWFVKGSAHDITHESSQVTPTYGNWTGKVGKVGVYIIGWRIKYFAMAFELEIEPIDQAILSWRLRLWKQARDQMEQQYDQQRKFLQDKLNRLQEELGAQDALSLRTKEREEVMLYVLTELGIPPKDLRDNNKKIKFVHQAIEWENMLYILYPYFWSTGTDPDPAKLDEYLEFKRYLDHPDPTHRAFLKSGAARVVLTIRPGFENAFLRFLKDTALEGDPEHPYLEIAEEFKAYASTNYPGIAPANPVEGARPLLTLKQKRAWNDMQLIMRLLETFYRIYHRYPDPAKNESLEKLREVFPMLDPWGYPYVYDYPYRGGAGYYTLACYGADGQPGGDGENADITSLDDSPNLQFLTQVQAWQDLQMIKGLIEGFFKDEQKYPASLNDLKAYIPLIDPWGTPYQYQYPGSHGEYDLASYGADKAPGGEDESADITSWAEASLIGTWYEYTPTSALDIEFDAKLPSMA
jgi:hypothetical protein